MNLITIKLLFLRRDVRIIIIGLAIGGGLQIFARWYLKRYPELLKDSPESKKLPPMEYILLEVK